MRLTVHLDSNANTEVKVLGENDTLMIIGGDEISTTDGMGSY
jgi:aspartyl aminopeptidase